MAACGCEKRRISIHAPAWGATRQLNRDTQRYSFQSTLPAWGATRKPFEIETERIYFNPRPRMGSDTSVSFLSVDRDLFQSTLPHGERLTGKGVGSITISISIHAPAWRATAAYGLASSTSAFQSTLPHGERRRIGIRRIGRRSISIHAPRMGSDSKNMRFLLCFCNFH